MSARLTASKICVLWTCTGRTWLKALLKLLLIQIATICYSLLDSPQYSDRANNPTANHDKAGTGALGRHSNETVRNLLLKRGPHQPLESLPLCQWQVTETHLTTEALWNRSTQGASIDQQPHGSHGSIARISWPKESAGTSQ